MPSPHTPGTRDRALGRLRRLTVGSTIGSVVALGVFATAAAASYSGKTTANVPATPSTSNPSTSAPTSSAPATTPTPQPQTTPTPVPTQVPRYTAPHATTGGT